MEESMAMFISILVTFIILEIIVILILALVYCLSKEGSNLEEFVYELLDGFFTSLFITMILTGVLRLIIFIFDIWR